MHRLIAIIAFCLSTTALAQQPTNIILIVADDLGYGDVGAYGATDILTPSIDRLASEGIKLNAFYTSPSCSLSRSMLMTGSYAPRLSGSRNYTPSSTVGIHDDEITLGEMLKSAGFATGLFGKWHLGDHYDYRPQRHGFDEFFGIPYSNDMWPFHPLEAVTANEDPRLTAARARAALTGYAGQGSSFPLGEGFPNLPLYDGDAIVEFNSQQATFGQAFIDRALQFIEDNKDASFFAYVPLTASHVPLHPSATFLGSSARDLYGDTVQEMDDGVGRILAKLTELGIDNDTLVIFLSDNGPWLEYGIDGGSADPLRGGKESQLEGGIRVPAVMRWPDGLGAGATVDEPVSLIDIWPTLAGLVGVSVPSDRTIDGVDAWPVLAGQAAGPLRNAIFGFDEADFTTVDLGAVRSGKWKLHVRTNGRTVTPLSLYDLDADIGETTNRLGDEPVVVAQLVALGEQLVNDIIDNQRPLGNVALSGDPFAQKPGTGDMTVVEAEHFHVRESRGGQNWASVSPRHSSAGESLQALPNNGTNHQDNYQALSPHLAYRVNIEAPGRYFVWARARGSDNNNDSLHVGLDGQAPLSGRRMEEIFDYWGWTSVRETGGRAYLDVASAGVHTLDVWMREDGVIVDKFILTTDAGFTPRGQGLVESRQVFVAQQNPPTANDDGPYAVDEGGAITNLFNVLDNDTDPDTANLNAVLVNAPTNSALFELRPDGTFDYTHDGGESSADSFTYRADDGNSQSNLATASITINPINDVPVLTRNGPATVNIVEGDAYVDAGATAFDAEDGDISGDVVVGGDVVDPNTGGTYVITYDVTDSAGAAATPVTRTINVAANAPPVITLNGSATVNVVEGYGYTDAGATATDAEDGDITANIVVGGDVVDTDAAGTYVITYNVSDSAGKTATEVSRTVTVRSDADANPPIITLVGSATVETPLWVAYTDAGATAMDDEDGDLTAAIVVGGDTVDTGLIGTYVITYNVSDSAGNVADEVTRTVIVPPPDTTAKKRNKGGGSFGLGDLLLLLFGLIVARRNRRLTAMNNGH